jgi:hypothetical protein
VTTKVLSLFQVVSRQYDRSSRFVNAPQEIPH